MANEEIEPFLSIINPAAGSSVSRHYRSQRNTGLVEGLEDDEAENVSDNDQSADGSMEVDEEDGGLAESVQAKKAKKASKLAKLAKFAQGEIDFSELRDEMLVEEDDTLSMTSTTRSRGKRAKKNNLDDMGSALLGHAELSFAKGLRDDAIQMVLQVIKERPQAYEPHQTIAYYYEQKIADEPDLDEAEKASLREKSLQFYLIGAHLNKRDGDNWWEVAKKHHENGKFEMAAHCYEMAAKYSENKGDVLSCLQSEAEILEVELKNIPKAITAYIKLLDEIVVTNQDQGDFALKLTRRIATLYFNNGQSKEGIAVFEKYAPRFEEYISSEEVNMYIDLLISEGCHTTALIAFSTYCAVEYFIQEANELTAAPKPLQEEWLTSNSDRLIAKPSHASTFPIDFTAKLVVCLIIIKAWRSIDELQQSLKQACEIENSDLFLDVADAYIKICDHEKAEFWLLKAMKNPEFKEKPHVWLRYARVVKTFNRIDQAIDAYLNCLRLNSSHLEAKHEVCQLLLKQNRTQEAIKYSEQSLDGSIVLDLLVIRCNLLYTQDNICDFISSAKTLLMYDIHPLTRENEFMAVIRSSNHKNRMESLKDEWKKDVNNSGTSASRPHFIGDTPEPSDFFITLKRLAFVYWKQDEFDELRRLLFSAYTSYVMSCLDSSLDFIAMNAIYLMKDTYYVYPFFKALAQRVRIHSLSSASSHFHLFFSFSFYRTHSTINCGTFFVLSCLALFKT